MDQKKAFYRQIISEFSSVRQEPVDIDIIVTSGNDDRKIMQSIRIASTPVQPVQMNIYQSNTYRRDLSWLHLHDEPGVQERQEVKDQKFYLHLDFCSLSNIFKQQLGAPAQTRQQYSMRGQITFIEEVFNGKLHFLSSVEFKNKSCCITPSIQELIC